MPKYHMHPPASCDICTTPILSVFYDARLGLNSPSPGSWANCCTACFKRYGIGLGTGYAQEWTKREDRFEKTA